MVTCPSCGSDELRLVEKLSDGRRHVACETCGHDWIRGEAYAPVARTETIAEHRAAFERNHQMTPRRRGQVETLKATSDCATPAARQGWGDDPITRLPRMPATALKLRRVAAAHGYQAIQGGAVA